MKLLSLFSLILMLTLSQQVAAQGQTISGTFLGSEPVMAADQGISCDATDKPYVEFATIQVTASGTYLFYDAGNSAFSLGDASPVADAVIMIYQDSFNPAAPAVNRIAQIDEDGQVQLNTDTTYIMVAQYWCWRPTYGIAPFAVVTFGPGSITGAGFNTPSYMLGSFAGASPTADFPDTGGVHAYAIVSGMSVPRTGNYFFSDIATLFASDVEFRVYKGSFDSNNTQANLTGRTSLAGPVFLEAGQTYVFVVVDIYDIQGEWQFALFPPGPFVFNPGLNGAWVSPGINAQGILAEFLDKAGVMFFAWFTFNHAPAVIVQDASIQAIGGGTKPQTHLGSSDQRWLTAAGKFPASGNTLNLSYENSSGGVFNSSNFTPATNSNYGTGSVALVDCDHMNISYNLPGGLSGTTLFQRILPDGARHCYDLTPQGPIQPPTQQGEQQ